MINTEQDYWNELFNDTQRLNGILFNDICFHAERPSTKYSPKLSIDGNQWCALYGDNLQDGVTGFGDSPNEAYENFDKNWNTKLDAKQ